MAEEKTTEKVLAEKEITNTYVEKLKNIDDIKKGLQDLMDGLNDHDAELQKGYDDIGDEIEKQRDEFKNLSKQYVVAIEDRDKAAKDAEKLLEDLDNKGKIEDETQNKDAENEPEYEISEDRKEWEETIKTEVPNLDLPELPDLREPLKIAPFERVPVIDSLLSPRVEETDAETEVEEKKPIDDEKALIFSDDEEVAPDEKEEDLIKEEELLNYQLKNESIPELLKIKPDAEAKAILGDPSKYDLPKENTTERKELEKDFEEISKSLKDITDDKMRQYAKLSALKDYNKLYDTYRRYCQAGGDLDWMNKRGWDAFIYDGDIAEKEGDADKKSCSKLHRKVYDAYHKKSKQRAARERKKKLEQLQKDNPAWKDDDPWTGQWIQDKGDDVAKETYHIKQFGIKLVGFIKVPDFCSIEGHIDEFAFLKGNYTLRWKEGARSGQRRICTVHLEPPEIGDDKVRMIVKWKEISTKSSNSGTYTMVKIDKKCAVNEKNVKIDIGLARHEFFDACMRLSKMKKKYKDMEEFQAMDGFTQDCIMDMIWNILFKDVDGNDVKKILKSNSTALHKLFNRYCSLNAEKSADDDLLGDDEWAAFCKHFAITAKNDYKIKGSAPNKIQILASFNFSRKLDKYEEELTYQGFETCIKNYVQAMYRKRKGANYKVMPYMDKMKLFCKIATKLEKSPVKK